MSGSTTQGVVDTPKLEEEINVKSVMTPEELQAMLPKNVELLESDAEVEGKLMEGVDPSMEELVKKFEDLTDEEKKELLIKQLKESRIRFKPIKHPVVNVVVGTEPTFFGRKKVLRSKGTITNITTNQFDAEYRKKRQRKNKMQKASRRLAHKK
jgi:hypothetical protein